MTGIRVLIVVALAAVLPAFAGSPASADGPPLALSRPASPPALSPARAKQAIAQRAETVVAALKRKDMARLARFVHPEKGVRFSPYTYVDPMEHRVFTRAQVRQLARDAMRYTWGAYDGTGKPIRLTFPEYYKGFVYDKDYARAKEIHYNTVKRRGNTINNLFSVYPNAVAVEYHVPGTGEQRDFNWGSLWLVFEKEAATWYLVGVVHDEWTI